MKWEQGPLGRCNKNNPHWDKTHRPTGTVNMLLAVLYRMPIRPEGSAPWPQTAMDQHIFEDLQTAFSDFFFYPPELKVYPRLKLKLLQWVPWSQVKYKRNWNR